VYERWNILVVADGGAVIEARHGRRRGADGCREVVDDPSSELTITLSIFVSSASPESPIWNFTARSVIILGPRHFFSIVSKVKAIHLFDSQPTAQRADPVDSSYCITLPSGCHEGQPWKALWWPCY
jgi:hypothetical protein